MSENTTPGGQSDIPPLPPEQPPAPPHPYAPQPAYGQPLYAQPMYAQPVYVASPPRGKSVASMVLGIVAIFFGYTLVVPIIGLILGIAGIKSEPAGKGMATAGIVMNGIMLAGWGILVIFGIIALIAGLGAAASVGSTYSY